MSRNTNDSASDFNIWDHFTKLDGKGTNSRLQCGYCEHAFQGSATRAKAHLLGTSLKGGGVKACANVPIEVKQQLQAKERADQESAKKKMQHMQALHSAEKSVASSSGSPTIQASFNKSRKTEVDDKIGICLCANGIAFNVVRSPEWKEMVSAIAGAGAAYKPPGYEHLRTTVLDRIRNQTERDIQPYMAAIDDTGCAITSDGWTDVCNRPLLNILVVSNKGACFQEAIDTGKEVKSSEYIAAKLKDAILNVGASRVVAVITDNAANCKGAGQLIEEEFPHISWQPCCAHVIDLLLEDIGQLDWAKSVINQGREVVTFIRNHQQSQALYRKVAAELKTEKELLKPGATRFATSFIMLERLIEVKKVLVKLVVDDEYNAWAEQPKYTSAANAISDIILSVTRNNLRSFWDRAEELVTICNPMVALLRKVDSNMPCTGKVYHGMYEIQQHVLNMAQLKRDKKAKLQECIRKRWDMLSTPLMLAGYALDPEWLDEPVSDNDEVMGGLYKMFDKLCVNREATAAAERDFVKFRRRDGLFARPTAMTNARLMPADEWWSLYGSEVPQLQGAAIKVLAQVASACACERNWSTFDFIHNKRRNRLSAKRAADLVYVFSNKRLARRLRDGGKEWVKWIDSSDSGSDGEQSE